MNQAFEAGPFFRRALLIINPVSGKKGVLRYIAEIVRSLMDAGYLVTATVTSRQGEATALARDLGKDFDLVCCTGGDGTLNETLSGLVQAKADVPIGYIPCGSTNDFAISRKLPTDIPTAARCIASGRCRRYDVGVFGDRVFSYVAAFGAFSWLSYTTDQNLKNVLGHTAYILDALKDVYKLKPVQLSLTANGVHYEGEYLFGAVCNSTSVAGTITLPEAIVDTCDGVLEVLDYLERIPDKLIPRRQELIESIRSREQKAGETEKPAEGLPAMGGSLDEDKLFGGLTGTVQARYDALPKVAQRALIGQAAK